MRYFEGQPWVEFYDFAMWVSRKVLDQPRATKEHMWEALRVYDYNEDGTIHVNALGKVLRRDSRTMRWSNW